MDFSLRANHAPSAELTIATSEPNKGSKKNYSKHSMPCCTDYISMEMKKTQPVLTEKSHSTKGKASDIQVNGFGWGGEKAVTSSGHRKQACLTPGSFTEMEMGSHQRDR